MALMPISIFAAGLGKLTVLSGLGEPLRADIELISVTPEELSSLTAAIANDEAYAAQGIERPAMHNNIQIELAKNNNGSPILKLKSNQPINDPFLDMLIQVDWASGRLLREYTVLIDPPGYSAQADKSNISQSIQAPSTKLPPDNTRRPLAAEPDVGYTQPDNASENGSTNKREGSKKTGKTAKVKPEKAIESVDSTQNTYNTKHGDTLSAVAKQMQVDGVSLEQMLVGLYEENPKAFVGENMNRMKSGQIIRVPTAESLNAVSKAQAHDEVKLQAENWNAYRNKLAGMVATSKPSAEESSKESTGGKVTTVAEDKAAMAKTSPKDVVKLSSGDVANAKGTEATKAAQAKIAAQEDATAKANAVKDALEKAALLDKQKETQKQLLALKSKAMSDLQNQSKDTTIKPEAAKLDAVKVGPEKVETPATVAAIQPAQVNVKPVEEAPKKPIAEKAKPVPVIPPAETLGFIEGLLASVDTAMLGLAGGTFALLGGGWLYLRNKRKRDLVNFEQGILTSGGLKANTVFGNTSGGKVDTGDTSFLMDFSQGTNGSMIDTNDVDPIAEAEVYMAYGREAQAEEILKDAIAKEPKRYELHLKLLEMYAARKDTAAYETIAGELYTTLGAGDATWAKVADMGASIEPDNPLYKTSSTVSSSVLGAVAHTSKLNVDDFSDIGEISSENANVEEIDFSLDSDNAQVGEDFLAESSKEEPSEFEFDLGDFDLNNQDSSSNIDSSSASKFDKESVFNESKISEIDFNAIDTNAFDTELSEEVSTNSQTPSVDTGMDFDIADIDDVSTTIKAGDESNFSHTLPSLSASTVESTADVAVTDINFDLPSFESSSTEDTSFNIGSLSSVKEEEDTIDFNFDVTDSQDDISGDISSFDGKLTASGVKPLDLSGISLDLDEENASLKTTPEVVSSGIASLDLSTKTDGFAVEVAALEDEPTDVETKLDLIGAYLDMDDKEGAKELLEEVLKEGGSRQITKAKELLANIA